MDIARVDETEQIERKTGKSEITQRTADALG